MYELNLTYLASKGPSVRLRLSDFRILVVLFHKLGCSEDACVSAKTSFLHVGHDELAPCEVLSFEAIRFVEIVRPVQEEGHDEP